MTLADAATYAVAHWALDEASGTRYDSIGSEDLTDNNTVTALAGKFSNAADFEASNGEYLSAADSTVNSLGNTDWMYRCWIKAETLASFPVVLAKRDSTDSFNTYALYYDTSANKLTWNVALYSGFSTVVQWGSALSTGTWYLVHVWHDATANEIGISVDAGTAVTTSWANGVGDGDGIFQIGASAAQSIYWDGLIDDVVLLDGYILDATERTEDYNSGTGVAFANWTGAAATHRPTLTLIGVG